MACPFSSSGSLIKDQVTTNSGNSGHVFTNETEEGSFETKDSNRQCSISVKSREYHFNDDDLLVSFILENKSFRSTTLPRCSARLLKRWPNTNIRNSLRGNLSTARPRTVLSWLINSRIISPGEGIHIWNLKDNIELEAWSAEYKALKARVETSQKDDYLCGLCGSGGNLVCCDNYRNTFHRECLSEKVSYARHTTVSAQCAKGSRP